MVKLIDNNTRRGSARGNSIGTYMERNAGGTQMPQLGRICVAALMMLSASWAVSAEPNDAFDPEAGGDYVETETCIECHEEKLEELLPGKHARDHDDRTPLANHGCESCHGRGETHAFSEGEDFSGLVRFGRSSPVPAYDQNAMCLDCHQDTGRMHWQGSAHESADLGCTDCHRIHQTDRILEPNNEMAVCADCHQKVRADLYKASAHPVRHGLIACSDCHDSHGSAGPAALQRLTLNQQCFACHAEKRGPFLWEHEPVTEDCASCHLSHGSNNPALLVRRAPFLCQQCHQVMPGGSHAGHINELYDWRGGKGKRRFLLGTSCMNCHPQVHGTNHPSGGVLAR